MCLIRLAVACLEETLAHYCAALLTYAKSITDAFLARTQADYDAITDFFERHCIKEKARALRGSCNCAKHAEGSTDSSLSRCAPLGETSCTSCCVQTPQPTGHTPILQVTKVAQPLDDLRDVAASDSVDTFVLSYTSLLQVLHAPHAVDPGCAGQVPPRLRAHQARKCSPRGWRPQGHPPLFVVRTLTFAGLPHAQQHALLLKRALAVAVVVPCSERVCAFRA